MSNFALYVDRQATRMDQAIVRDAVNVRPVAFPELIIGSTRQFRLSILDGANGVDAISGSATVQPIVTIGDTCAQPTGGTWTFTRGANTTSALAYNIDAAALQSAIEGLASVGSGNVSVKALAGNAYQIEYIGGLSDTAITDASSDGESLTPSSNATLTRVTEGGSGDNEVQIVRLQQVPFVVQASWTSDGTGWTGTLSTGTWEALTALAAESPKIATVQVLVILADGSTEKLALQPARILCDVSDPSQFVPASIPSFYTAAQINALLADYVSLTGTQTITGQKTFNDLVIDKFILPESTIAELDAETAFETGEIRRSSNRLIHATGANSYEFIGQSVEWANTVWLSKSEGNDSTGQAANPGRPFLTWSAAVAAVDALGPITGVKIEVVADVSGSLDGTYFILQDSAGSVGVWIDVDDSGTTIPAGASAADRAIEITTIATDDTAISVGDKIAAVLEADGSFNATGNQGTVIVINSEEGLTGAADGDAGFDVSDYSYGGNVIVTDGDFSADSSTVLGNGATYEIRANADVTLRAINVSTAPHVFVYGNNGASIGSSSSDGSMNLYDMDITASNFFLAGGNLNAYNCSFRGIEVSSSGTYTFDNCRIINDGASSAYSTYAAIINPSSGLACDVYIRNSYIENTSSSGSFGVIVASSGNWYLDGVHIKGITPTTNNDYSAFYGDSSTNLYIKNCSFEVSASGTGTAYGLIGGSAWTARSQGNNSSTHADDANTTVDGEALIVDTDFKAW